MMITRPTIENLISKEDVSEFYQIIRMLEIEQAAIKDKISWVKKVLHLKYGEAVFAKRQALGKNTGVIHIEEAEYRLDCYIDKKVEWQQKQLAQLLSGNEIDTKLAQKLKRYTAVTYNIPELKYNKMDEELKALVAQARVVKTGNPNYKITKLEG